MGELTIPSATAIIVAAIIIIALGAELWDRKNLRRKERSRGY